MATTTDYLNQLKKDLTTAKTNLANLGVEVLESDTFTEVSEKMASIQSGADLSEYFTETIGSGKKFITTILKTPPFFFSGTSCNSMFSGLDAKEIDVSNFDTSNTTTFYTMFSTCKKLVNIIGLEKIKTDNATTIGYMFQQCEKLVSLDLTHFNTSKVTEISNMFLGCIALVDLDISSFDLSKVVKLSYTFNDCTKLTNLSFGKNLGAGFLTSQSANYSYYKLDVSKSTLLTEASLISVLNGLYDIKSKGCNPQQCVLGSTNLAKLTSEAGQQALAQAQAYGWTVS